MYKRILLSKRIELSRDLGLRFRIRLLNNAYQHFLINDRTVFDGDHPRWYCWFHFARALLAPRWSAWPRRMQHTPSSLYAHNIIAQCNLLKFEVSRSTRYIHYVRSNYQAYRQERPHLMSRPVTCNRYDFWYRRYVTSTQLIRISSKAKINIGIVSIFLLRNSNVFANMYKLHATLIITPVSALWFWYRAQVKALICA